MENVDDSRTVLDKIKSKGHYKIRFVPSKPLQSDFLKSMDGFARYQFFINSVVSLRGWDYPHFPTSDVGTYFYRIKDGYESFTNFGYLKEVWRLMDSGQFVHFKSLCEDWGEEDDVFGYYKNVPPLKYLNVIDCIYVITEIFVFVRNLFKNGFYSDDSKLTVSIDLIKMVNRKLTHNDPRRAPILGDFICRIPNIHTEITVNRDDVLKNHVELATKVILDIHRYFNSNDIPESSIMQIQQGLIKRTFD